MNDKRKPAISPLPRETASCLPHIPFSSMIGTKEVEVMETKNVILELRTKKGMSQDDLAEK